METQSPRGIDVTIPTDLESARAKMVYLYVAVGDGTTIDRLCADLGVKKGTALSITATLRSRGHVERTDHGFVLA